MFARQTCEHFDFLESGRFYLIMVADSCEVCANGLKNANVMTDGILWWTSLRCLLGLYTLVYKPLNQKRLVDLHPDFMKFPVSGKFLYLSMKLGFFNRIPLAGSHGAAAKAKARSQVIARAFMRAGQFSIPERARVQFKADMLDQLGELEAERVQRYAAFSILCAQNCRSTRCFSEHGFFFFCCLSSPACSSDASCSSSSLFFSLRDFSCALCPST